MALSVKVMNVVCKIAYVFYSRQPVSAYVHKFISSITTFYIYNLNIVLFIDTIFKLNLQI